MDDIGVLGNTLGRAAGVVKKGGREALKVAEEAVKDAKDQIVGKKQEDRPRWQSDEERVKFLKDLYGSAKQNSSSDVSDKSASYAKASAAKPEEQKQLLELRRDLHKQVYYDQTFNPPKKQEERPAEKVENEKKQEMMELQKKEEKKPPLAVVREQNKAEMFRGVSG